MMNMVGRVVGALCVACLAWSRATAAAPAMITDIQYWLAPDHIQTIIFFDRPVQPTSHTRQNPERFVLEIADCQDLFGDRAIDVNDVALRRIRVQRLQNGTMQIVFDLTRKIEATVQALPSFQEQPDRVIVNLFDEVAQEQVEQERVERQQETQALKNQQYHIVVLDPGHGGHDPGASSPNGLKEKDVVLDLAKKIQARLEKIAPNIKVYLTRDSDYFLPLPKRTDIAKEYQADLFISLHVNSNTSKKAQGFSVYTLSEKASDEAARLLAEQENASDLLLSGKETPIPSNSEEMLTFVLADFMTSADLERSLRFSEISTNLVVASLRQFGVQKEGLKRANFVVLRSASMPAVLIEACYISNGREGKLLEQPEFRGNIAFAVAKSIQQYFDGIGAFDTPQMAQLSQKPASAAAGAEQQKVHIVKPGESLSLIAGKYNINLALLRQANQLVSADMIYVGQRLWIP